MRLGLSPFKPQGTVEPAPTFRFGSGIGINTGFNSYYDPQKAFLNMAKVGGSGATTKGATTYLQGRWVPHGPLHEWDTADEIILNSDGYVTSLAGATSAAYLVASSGAGHASGNYVIKWSGSPTVVLTGTSTHTITSSSANRIELTWNGAWLFVEITAVGSPVMSNLVVCRAEDEAALDAGGIFRSDFLSMMSGLSSTGKLAFVRTLDFQDANNSPETTTIRPESFISWVKAPPSVCAKLAVALNTDLWWICPYQATVDYMDDAAAAIFAVLDAAGKHVVVEWGNEVWNTGFSHYSYCLTQGAALGSTDAEKVYRYQAQQSLLLWDAFETAGFVPGTTQWNVLAGFINSSTPTSTMAEYVDPTFGLCSESAHFFAIAPYPGIMPSNGTQTAYVLAQDPADLFDTTESTVDHLGAVLADVEAAIIARVAEADGYEMLGMLAYEGGQHCVGVGTEQSDLTLAAYLVAMQDMPEMGTLYTDLMDVWKNNGGQAFCHYKICSEWNQFGSFGLVTDQTNTPLATNYVKYNAVQAYPAAPWWDESVPVPGADRLIDTLVDSTWTHAYGLELLTGAYESQPLVRLRRSSDSAESDFSHASGSNFLDMTAVLAWSTTDTVYVVKVYDQIGINHLTQSTTTKQAILVNAGTPVAYGSSNRAGVVGRGSSENASTTAPYYSPAANVTLGSDGGYLHAYHRGASGDQVVGFCGQYTAGSGYHAQWEADSNYHHQDLSSATPSRTDTADRYGAADTSTGMKIVVGRRSSASEEELWINGTQRGSTRTGIGAAGPLFDRFMADAWHAGGQRSMIWAIAKDTRPSDADLALIAAHFATNYPD